MDVNGSPIKKRRKRGKSLVGQRRKRHFPHSTVACPISTATTNETAEINSTETIIGLTISEAARITEQKDWKRVTDKSRYESKLRTKLQIDKDVLVKDNEKLVRTLGDRDEEATVKRMDALLDCQKVQSRADKEVADIKRSADRQLDKMQHRIGRHDVSRRTQVAELQKVKADHVVARRSQVAELQKLKTDHVVARRTQCAELQKLKTELKTTNSAIEVERSTMKNDNEALKKKDL